MPSTKYYYEQRRDAANLTRDNFCKAAIPNSVLSKVSTAAAAVKQALDYSTTACNAPPGPTPPGPTPPPFPPARRSHKWAYIGAASGVVAVVMMAWFVHKTRSADIYIDQRETNHAPRRRRVRTRSSSRI